MNVQSKWHADYSEKQEGCDQHGGLPWVLGAPCAPTLIRGVTASPEDFVANFYRARDDWLLTLRRCVFDGPAVSRGLPSVTPAHAVGEGLPVTHTGTAQSVPSTSILAPRGFVTRCTPPRRDRAFLFRFAGCWNLYLGHLYYQPSILKPEYVSESKDPPSRGQAEKRPAFLALAGHLGAELGARGDGGHRQVGTQLSPPPLWGRAPWGGGALLGALCPGGHAPSPAPAAIGFPGHVAAPVGAGPGVHLPSARASPDVPGATSKKAVRRRVGVRPRPEGRPEGVAGCGRPGIPPGACCRRPRAIGAGARLGPWKPGVLGTFRPGCESGPDLGVPRS